MGRIPWIRMQSQSTGQKLHIESNESVDYVRSSAFCVHGPNLCSPISSVPHIGSPLCFLLAGINFPHAIIYSTWGQMAEDLSDETWDALDHPDRRIADDRGLGMLLKMTRCHDLGLGQLFFPGEDMDAEAYTSDSSSQSSAQEGIHQHSIHEHDEPCPVDA